MLVHSESICICLLCYYFLPLCIYYPACSSPDILHLLQLHYTQHEPIASVTMTTSSQQKRVYDYCSFIWNLIAHSLYTTLLLSVLKQYIQSQKKMDKSIHHDVCIQHTYMHVYYIESCIYDSLLEIEVKLYNFFLNYPTGRYILLLSCFNHNLHMQILLVS